MENFSLINFINQKSKITPEVANIIVQSLLRPHGFSKKGAEKISLWYQTLSEKEKKHLYENPSFKNALTKSSFLCPKTKISSLWLNDIFKQTKYNIPQKFIQKLADAFVFTSIKLPSNVEISVNAETFFQTLAKGINNHPHLIDEFKDFLNHAQLPLHIAPENGDLIKEKFLGLFSCIDNTLYFQADHVCYNTLDTLIHEIGHAADSQKFKELFDKTSLYIYYDEVRQETKSFLIETKEQDSKQGDINPFEDLYFYIKHKIKEKYPSLNEEKIERATAFWFKNEIISIASLSKNQLINVLNIWHSNNIKYTDQIFQKIEYLKKQYTHPIDILYSFKTATQQMQSLFFKQVKKPLYFTRQMIKELHTLEFFSNDLLNELSNHAGFIESEENLSFFMLKTCALNTENNNVTLLFDLKKFNNETISQLQSFYAQRGIFLLQKDKTLYTTNHDSIERMSRLIQQFFSKMHFGEETSFYHFSNKLLSKETKQRILNFLTEKNISYKLIEKDIFVSENDLSDKNIIQHSKKTLLVQTPKTKENHSNMLNILNVMNVNPRIYTPTKETHDYLLVSETELNNYFKAKELLHLAQDLHQYYYEYKSQSKEIFIPNRLLAKKEKLSKIHSQKIHQKEKD